MAGKILNYFAGGNTARGFYNLYNSNLEGLDRVYLLQGVPGTGISRFMKKIGSKWQEKGYDIEILHSSSENDAIDGIIIPKLKLALVDGNAPRVIEPKSPQIIKVDFNEALSNDLTTYEKTTQKLWSQLDHFYQKAYKSFAEALKIHDEWEKIYIDEMDFNKADALTCRVIESLLGVIHLNKKPRVCDRFLGAATPKGAVDFVPNLTEDIKKRYFIKGRPGSGKSTLLKKLADAAAQRGLDVEIYHCGFDPNSLDMIILRELSVAVFDSTAPHEYFPTLHGDEIIDMYGLLITPGTDQDNAEALIKIMTKYKTKISEATSYLANAKEQRDELELIYTPSIDSVQLSRTQTELLNQLTVISAAQNP